MEESAQAQNNDENTITIHNSITIRDTKTPSSSLRILISPYHRVNLPTSIIHPALLHSQRVSPNHLSLFSRRFSSEWAYPSDLPDRNITDYNI